ncbi:MAG: hypothetical protein Q9206_003216 [Seirophora lacunosa]
MDQPSTMGYLSKPADALSQQEPVPALQANTVAASMNNGLSDPDDLPKRHQPDQGDRDYVLAFENENLAEDLADEMDTATAPNHLSTSSAQPSASIPTLENVPSHPQDDPSSNLTQAQNALSESSKINPDPTQFAQDASAANETDAKSASSSPSMTDDHTQDGGVNYQTLLDNLSPSTATAPSAENISSITTAAPSTASNVPRPSSAESPISTLPLPPGLPPRPPPQEKPVIHPNYTAEGDIRSYHYPHVQATNAPSPSVPQANNPVRPVPGFNHPLPPNASVGSNGLPPPPLATFQQLSPQAIQPPQLSPITPQSRQPEIPAQAVDRNAVALESSPSEAPWPPELERSYDDFVSEEAKYVAEGVWDRFPPGSRLFVGKRNLIYGKLAQISIKNAYGFIQFFDAVCSNRAIQGEQGSTIRGRKIHLEISKPQKNTRNAANASTSNNQRSSHGRRSRSPEYDRSSRASGGRTSIDRGVPYGGFPSELRRRDDYRPVRSPSPRGFRGRDEHRGRNRSPDRYYPGRRSRSRSPYGRGERYRSRSPRGPDMDDETNLPMPRRDPRNVPEVQMILVDEVDRTFVAYIEKTFRDRGLSCHVFQLPRVSLTAVIKRQILEGVQAVVKILRQSQVSGKIPLQVFDYSAGVDNVRFEEYDELDAHIAAELVARAKATRLAPPPVRQPITPSYGAPQYGRSHQHQMPPQQMPPPHIMAPQQPQQAAAAPNIANLITSLDGPALQKLLGAMQNPQSPHAPQPGQAPTPQQPPHMPDLSSMLGVSAQQQAHQGYPQYPQGGPSQSQQQSPYGASANEQPFANNPVLASLFANVGAGRQSTQQGVTHQQHQGQPGQQQHVQNLMEQLARWKQ